MRIVELARQSDARLLKRLTAFPEENDLPDLRKRE
jgi:hypothetical protein